MRAFLEKFGPFQIVNVILDAFLQVRKCEEIDFVNGLWDYSVACFLSFNFLANVVVGEGKHSTISVVEDRNFGRAKETLRNHDTPKRLLAEKIDGIKKGVNKQQGMVTYAEPPALRMTWASPRLIWRWAAGLKTMFGYGMEVITLIWQGWMHTRSERPYKSLERLSAIMYFN